MSLPSTQLICGWLLAAGLIGASVAAFDRRLKETDTADRPSRPGMADSMARMAEEAGNTVLTGNADHDFSAMMIVHHQGAVEMAQVELLHGRDPILRRLAQEIVVTQTAEIAVLRGQLAKERQLCR